MVALSFSQWVLVFTLYSIMGWLVETLCGSVAARRFTNRGFLSGPWCPAYGFGVVAILLISAPIADRPGWVFMVSVFCAFATEYLTGWLMETLFHARWWDYSNRRLQIKGRVWLPGTLIQGLLGMGAVLFQPVLAGMLGRIPPTVQRVLASVLIIALLFDLLRSLGAAASLREHLRGLKVALDEMQQYQEEQGTYDPANIPGSIKRLYALCVARPGNTVACGIAARIEKELRDGNGSVRLVRAFPTMRPHDFLLEHATLQDEWDHKRKLRDENRIRGWPAIRDKLEASFTKTRLSYKGITLTRMVWVFLIGCVIGYVVETVFCFVSKGVIESRQGMIYGPFNQVYGLGAVLLVLALTPFASRGDGWLFIGGAVVGGIFEAVCSVVQEHFFGSVSWEYSQYPYSLFGGRTNLLLMLFWGILGVAYMRFVYPRMAKLIDRIPKAPKRFFTVVIVVFLSANMALSAMAVGRWSERVSGIPAEGSVDTWLDRRYPNELLKSIYPSMEFCHRKK